MEDLPLLVKATLSIYFRALKKTLEVFLKKGWIVVFHFVGLLFFGFVAPLVSNLGGVVAGFVMFFVLCVFLSAFFYTIAAAISGDDFSFEDFKHNALNYLSSTINVFFVFWIVGFLVETILYGPNFVLPKVVFSLLIAVLFNPIPEVIVLSQRYSGLESLAESLEFIKENFVEWFLPVLFLIPVFIFLELDYESFVLLLATENPLKLLEKFLLLFGNLDFLFASPLLSGVVLIFVYFIFILRAFLYQEFSSSSRRKRVYQYRASHDSK